MSRTTGFNGFQGMRVLAVLVGLAIGGPVALAQDTGAPSSAKTPEVAATSPAARAALTLGECPSEPVTIWYLNNPGASGGLYNNPWANCKLPGSPR